MTKQEVYKQMEAKKKDRVMNHLRLIKIHGQARSLNQREWNGVVTGIKGSFFLASICLYTSCFVIELVLFFIFTF